MVTMMMVAEKMMVLSCQNAEGLQADRAADGDGDPGFALGLQDTLYLPPHDNAGNDDHDHDNNDKD